MSYILSALKKAEQERHSGDVPDVLTPQIVEEERSAARVPKWYFAGGLAAVLLAGLWAGNVFRFTAEDPGRPGSQMGSELLAPRPPPSAGAAPVVPAGVVPAASPGLNRRPPPDSPPNSLLGTMQPQTGADSALLPRTPYEGFSGDAAVQTPSQIPGQTPSQTPSKAPANAPSAPRNAAGAVPTWAREWPAGDAIPDVAELPPSLRKNLPPLELTGHLYSLGHPSARKVILNGAALKEGQYLDDDLMVSEITPDGVILDFHGRLFRIGADLMFR